MAKRLRALKFEARREYTKKPSKGGWQGHGVVGPGMVNKYGVAEAKPVVGYPVIPAAPAPVKSAVVAYPRCNPIRVLRKEPCRASNVKTNGKTTGSQKNKYGTKARINARATSKKPSAPKSSKSKSRR